jgi:hypothetical protein
MKGVSVSEKVKSVKVVQRLRCSVAMIYRLPPFGYSECACCNELCITESCAGMPAFTPPGCLPLSPRTPKPLTTGLGLLSTSSHAISWSHPPNHIL